MSIASILARLAVVLPAVAVAGAAPPARSPAATVRAFYAYHFAHRMAFTPAAVRRRAGWLSPELLVLCRSYFARPERPDEVPAIDGDPFTDSQEHPKSFQVGAAMVSGSGARVPVVFSWAGRERRTVSVALKFVKRAWRIADINYETGSSLRGLLLAGGPAP